MVRFVEVSSLLLGSVGVSPRLRWGPPEEGGAMDGTVGRSDPPWCLRGNGCIAPEKLAQAGFVAVGTVLVRGERG